MGTTEFTQDFSLVGNLTTYIITAAFAGDTPTTASATSTALDGTSYAACNTTQYNLNATTLGYQPSASREPYSGLLSEMEGFRFT